MCYTKSSYRKHTRNNREENIMQHETVIVLDFGGQYNHKLYEKTSFK